MTASAEKDSRREAGSRSVRSDDLPAEPQKSGLLTEAFSQTAALTMIWGSQQQEFLHFTRPGSSILPFSCKKTHKEQKRKLVRLRLNFQNQVLVQELTDESGGLCQINIRHEIKPVLRQQILWKDQNQQFLTSCLSLSAPPSSWRHKSLKTPQKYVVFIF